MVSITMRFRITKIEGVKMNFDIDSIYQELQVLREKIANRDMITRRIDDFGRVVIPKEVREKLCINSGDTLGLFLEGDVVCIRKL